VRGIQHDFAARTLAKLDMPPRAVCVAPGNFRSQNSREPKDYLGIEISRDVAVGTITSSQESKALALSKKLGVTGSWRALPMSPETYAGLRAAKPGEPMTDKLEYQQVVSNLLSLAQCTRPDIELPVSALAAYVAAPSKGYHAALLDIVRYVGSAAA
jgi:hypothetical protein